ncbi:MAG: GNAT family N-acetyltransferase [Armatimonadetes bacterium]|nr:GNAT family N-acetyltransferase [Armatimonadota bacterium]
MARKTFTPQLTPRELGDGLVLRQATRRDRKAIADFNEAMHASGWDPPGAVGAWTRDLLSEAHPTCGPEWFTLVEDTRKGEIVSTLCLIPNTWSYGGVHVPVGIPELVGTKKDYRRKGLIRAQFDVVHEWSKAAGHLVQAIGGIPYFYRQFGYEMALSMSTDVRLHVSAVPKLKKGEKEPFRVRRATRADIAYLARTYEHGVSRGLVSAVRDREAWRYDIDGRTRKSTYHHQLCVIESAGGRRVGFLAYEPEFPLKRNALRVGPYELAPGVSWLAVTPSVLRYLADYLKKYAARRQRSLEWITFAVPEKHPVARVPGLSAERAGEPYAYYIRVADVPGFLRQIAPVLEGRLAESLAVGHTGELKLNFYRDGVRLVFARGKLKKVEAWKPAEGESASFPFLTFLQLLFGRRSYEELNAAYADCEARGEAAVLLDILFPKMASEVWEAL